MNTTVTASNMQVKAVAEQGILINEESAADSQYWDNQANTVTPTAIVLHATSTANTSNWYVAHSKVQDDAAAATSGVASTNLTSDGYKILGGSGEGHIATSTSNVAANPGSSAAQTITYVDTGESGYSNGEGYYVMYTYYVKSSADAISLTTTAAGQSFNIKSVTATPTASADPSTSLDKSLRVAVVVGGKAYIYAPLYAADSLPAYYVAAGSSATTPISHTVSQPTALSNIPATTAAGTPVYVYLYFEGEDTNLKTSNVTTALDNITVEVQFELVTNAAAVTDRGVSLS